MYFFGLRKLPLARYQFSCLGALLYYSQKIKMNGKFRNYCYFALVLCITSCSPSDRLLRILKNNPNIYENYRRDSIQIRNVRTTDSVFFFQKERDTITFENATIYRESDTLRLVQSCPSCTTFITQQILQPSQKIIKEKSVKRSLREKLEDALLALICGFFVGFIINIKR